MRKFTAVFLLSILLWGCAPSKKIDRPLSEDEISNGFIEALNIGAQLAFDTLSKPGGYFKNDSVKIYFPPEANELVAKFRILGMGPQVDKVVEVLNHTAEGAIRNAQQSLSENIKNLFFIDAMFILKNPDTIAATVILKKKCSNELKKIIKPVIKKSLDTATPYWGETIRVYNNMPYVQQINPDMDEYVAQKAIDGLFIMIGQTEINIRKNPDSRKSELLKRVFGSPPSESGVIKQ